jgi:glutamyl-tRNA synthetase
MTDPIVVRFAPSPTGFLHIGSARTALFNWLYARARGGRMLLRIEDTDRERSTEPAIAAILDGLAWLGIEWDGETIYQFARAARHREVAESMLAAGNAYHCYASPDELKEMREKARAEGRSKLYDGRWRDRDAAEAPPGVKPVIRLKAPLTGETVIEDQVQGRVAWQNENLDDLVLLRSDGTPTYMLAVVVDDHDMGITHIIRGDDHLTNAARQKQIYDALGWTVPVMAHIPARFDFAKLESLSGHYIRQTADADLLAEIERVLPHIAGGQELAKKLTPELRGKLIAAMPGLKERAKTLVELVDAARYVFADRPLALDDKAAVLLTPEARTLLGDISAELKAVEPWTVEATEQVVRAFAERRGIKLGGVAQPLRAALTGRTTSPPIFDVLAVLGKSESLGRLHDQIAPGTRPAT